MPSSETGIPTPFDINAIPCGYDRAGKDVNVGTVEQDKQLISSSSASGEDLLDDPADMAIEEEPDSPVLENAEQQTITHRLHGGWNTVINEFQVLHRGIIRSDSNSEYFHVYFKLLSATMQAQGKRHASLHTVEEAFGGDTPPDLFECVPVDLGLNIIKHPRYYYSFLGDGQGSDTEQKNQMVIRLLQNYFENTTAAYRDALQLMLCQSLQNAVATGSYNGAGPQPPTGQMDTSGANPGEWVWNPWFDEASAPQFAYISGTPLALAAALEIVTKYWRGLESPPVFGFQVRWTEFAWKPVPLNPGGYIVCDSSGTPSSYLTEDYWNPLPDYLWNTHFPMTSADTWDEDSMFAFMGAINPQCYSSTGEVGGATSISWLRQPDQPVRNRTFWEIQHSWFGAMIGHWDPQVFAVTGRPKVPSDYLIADCKL